ncbi:MAG: AtpZ/AtpI family protein [Tenericutes bacterium]|nr:AtpZ/AtpI family protein [Mycoplasmatota bacterium]
MDKKKYNKSVIVTINMITSFFTETFVGMGIGYFIGRFLDNLFFADKDILAYVFLFLGLFAGLANFIKRALKKIMEENKDEKS